MSVPPIPRPRRLLDEPACLVPGAIARSIDDAYTGYLLAIERASVPSGTDAGAGPEG